MGRKAKISYEQKLNAVLDYENGKNSLRGIASKVGVETIPNFV